MKAPENLQVIDQAALRNSFFALYSERRFDDPPSGILAKLRVSRGTFEEWLRDPDFLEQLQRIDAIRTWEAREVFARHARLIAERMCETAISSDPRESNARVRAGELALKVLEILQAGGSGGSQVLNITNNVQAAVSVEDLRKRVTQADDILGRYNLLEEGDAAEPA